MAGVFPFGLFNENIAWFIIKLYGKNVFSELWKTTIFLQSKKSLRMAIWFTILTNMKILILMPFETRK